MTFRREREALSQSEMIEVHGLNSVVPLGHFTKAASVKEEVTQHAASRSRR